jgi:hypothetical protein
MTKPPPRTDELFKRAVDAAKREQPPAALTKRMAQGVGLTAGALMADSAEAGGTAGKVSPNVGDVALQGNALAGMGGGLKTAAVTKSSGLLWLGGSAAAAALATALFVVQAPPNAPAPAPIVQVTAPPAQLEEALPSPTPKVSDTRAQPEASSVPPNAPARPLGNAVGSSSPREPSGSPKPTLRDEIALVDEARAALRAGNAEQVLTLCRKYEARHPRGSFGPEISALRIEALVRAGRRAEARALAERFVSQWKGTPLADRVSRMAGLSER